MAVCCTLRRYEFGAHACIRILTLWPRSRRLYTRCLIDRQHQLWGPRNDSKAGLDLCSNAIYLLRYLLYRILGLPQRSSGERGCTRKFKLRLLPLQDAIKVGLLQWPILRQRYLLVTGRSWKLCNRILPGATTCREWFRSESRRKT